MQERELGVHRGVKFGVVPINHFVDFVPQLLADPIDRLLDFMLQLYSHAHASHMHSLTSREGATAIRPMLPM
ncbi:MAG: hypothetical protein JO283_18850 [Bradyrhizobium sp.]|nr:hypothetical protein [Bradyrhizobium sp.]